MQIQYRQHLKIIHNENDNVYEDREIECLPVNVSEHIILGNNVIIKILMNIMKRWYKSINPQIINESNDEDEECVANINENQLIIPNTLITFDNLLKF